MNPIPPFTRPMFPPRVAVAGNSEGVADALAALHEQEPIGTLVVNWSPAWRAASEWAEAAGVPVERFELQTGGGGWDSKGSHERMLAGCDLAVCTGGENDAVEFARIATEAGLAVWYPFGEPKWFTHDEFERPRGWSNRPRAPRRGK